MALPRTSALGPSIPITHRTLSPEANKQSGVRSTAREVNRSFQNFSGLFAGRVIRVDPANNCCDIQLLHGGVLHEVTILQGNAGTIDGIYAVPKIKPPKKKDNQNQSSTPAGTGTNTTTPAGTTGIPTSAASGEVFNSTGSTAPDQADQQAKADDDDDVDSDDGRVSWDDIKDADLAKADNKRDTWAICGYVLASVNMPVVLGFFYPHSTQMSIKQDQENKKDRIDYLRRLPSRAYELHLRGGVYEFNFPDGSHFRIGPPTDESAPKKDTTQGGDGQTQGTGTGTNAPGTQPNPNLPLAGIQSIGPVNLGPTPGPIPTDTQLTQDPSNEGLQDPNNPDATKKDPGEFYDDDASDPDARIVLGKDKYENLDVKDKPWKIKKDTKKRRMMMVHATKAKLGICEHGVVHIQNFTDKASESSAPDGYDELDGGTAQTQKISSGDMDVHQRRLWRARWGDQASPPDKPQVGEHWFDPQERRNRYYIIAPSDGGGAGSLNDPSWQNAPDVKADPSGTGNVGESGQGDPTSNPPNRGATPEPTATGTFAKASDVKLNDHGIYADAMVGGRMGTSKWAANNGIDVFVPDGTPFRAPADGTISFSSAPSPSPLNPGGTMNGATINFTSGELAGISMHLLHISGGKDGPFKAGDVLTTAHDAGLGDPNGPGGCNWQHFDVAFSHSGSFEDGSPTPSGDIPAASFLQQLGFNVSQAQGQTSGPDQLVRGGCPFDNAGGEGGPDGGKQDAKRQWYMPAATPAGGGVKGKVQSIGEKNLDSKAAEKGGRGTVDAAAADHVHAFKTGSDDDVQPVGGEGSSGSIGSGSAVALANHTHPGPTGGMWITNSMDIDLLGKIEALEQRVRELEATK